MKRITKCINCGGKPVITEQEGEYKYLLSHKNEFGCYVTYKLQSHQHTKEACINDWNEFNQE